MKWKFYLGVAAILVTFILLFLAYSLPKISWNQVMTIESPVQNGAVTQVATGQPGINLDETTKSMTQLEQRLSPLENRRRLEAERNILLSDQYWPERADIIAGSDPLEDARKDVADGIIGFMVSFNIGFGAHSAIGLICPDRRIIRRNAIFTDSHGDYLPGSVSLAFFAYHAYARTYNQSRFVAELRDETDCEIDTRPSKY